MQIYVVKSGKMRLFCNSIQSIKCKTMAHNLLLLRLNKNLAPSRSSEDNNSSVVLFEHDFRSHKFLPVPFLSFLLLLIIIIVPLFLRRDLVSQPPDSTRTSSMALRTRLSPFRSWLRPHMIHSFSTIQCQRTSPPPKPPLFCLSFIMDCICHLRMHLFFCINFAFWSSAFTPHCNLITNDTTLT